MDKETLSHYGWIVIVTLILAVMLAFASPFGNFVANGVKAFTAGFVDTNNEALSDEYMQNIQDEWEEQLNDCEHEFIRLANEKTATCQSAGYTGDKVCNGCGKTMETGTVIAKLDHTPVTDNAVPATCEQEGKTEGSHCSSCNTVLVTQTTTDALGHDWGDPYVATEATCLGNGISRIECKRDGCDAHTDSTIKAEGHTIVTMNGKAATCTATGLTTGEKCSVCGTITEEQQVIPALSHTVVKDSAIQASCEVAGKTEGSHCSVCKTVIKAQETVPALGHSMGTPVTTLTATCTSEGQTKTSCTRTGCGYYEVSKISAKGHTEVIDKAVAATCTATGLTEGKHCSVCSAVIKAQTTVAKAPHTSVTDNAVSATCTKTGLTAGNHCSVCNTVLTAQTVTDALGHSYGTPTYTWTGTTTCKASRTCSRCSNLESQNGTISNAVTTAAKCTTAGVRTYTAKFGNTAFATQTKTESIAATGHTEVTDNAVSATCTATGLTAGSHCSACNTVLTAQTVTDALGHSYGTPTYTWTGTTTCKASRTCSRCSNVESQNGTISNAVTTAAKCTTAGVRTYTAKFGNTAFATQTKTESIAATGHSEVTDKAVAATCTKTGLTAGKHCSVCNTVLTAQTTTPALGHSYTTTTTAATCTTGGKITKVCNTCSDTVVTTTDALGHLTQITNKRDTTCADAGYSGDTVCGRCEEILATGTIIEATGHTDDDNNSICDNCGKIITPLVFEEPYVVNIENIDFSLVFHENGSLDIVSGGKIADTMPEGTIRYDGNKLWITENGEEGLFMMVSDDGTYLHNEDTPDEKEYILNGGLSLIPEGGTYYIGVTSTTLGDYSGATEVLVGGVDSWPTTANIGDVYVYGDYEYRNGYIVNLNSTKSSTSSVQWKVPTASDLGGVMVTPGDDKEWCARVLNANKTTYEEMLSTIGRQKVRFAIGTYAGTNIEIAPNIPDSVSRVMSGTFAYCENLTETFLMPEKCTTFINVFQGCKQLTKINHLPSDCTDMTEAFKECISLEIAPTLPANIRDLNGAFWGCKSLKQVTIPESERLLNITSGMFRNCESLTSIVIPKNIKAITSHAFYGCNNLTSITFEHTSSDELNILSDAFVTKDSVNVTTTIYVPDASDIHPEINGVANAGVGCNWEYCHRTVVFKNTP